MARIRSIKPEFYLDEDLAECSVWARLAFPGLWQQADGHGRLEDRPKRLKLQILPYDEVDMDALLDELASKGMILRYAFDGLRFIQVVNFRKHQRITGKEATEKSTFPEPETPARKHEGNNGETTVKHWGSTDRAERKGREGKGKEGKGKPNCQFGLNRAEEIENPALIPNGTTNHRSGDVLASQRRRGMRTVKEILADDTPPGAEADIDRVKAEQIAKLRGAS